MNIRTANKLDLKEIAEVHEQCFPNSFSTQLGKKLLEKFYWEYLSINPDLFLVGIDENKVVGFCMGYLCESNEFMKSFFKHNILSIACRCAYLLVTGNKLLIQKLKKRFDKTEGFHTIDNEIDKIPIDNRGDLLSICVLRQCRGNGMAQNMIENYEKILKEKGRKLCVLTVDHLNERAVRFYERNSYKVYKKAPTATTYVKELS